MNKTEIRVIISYQVSKDGSASVREDKIIFNPGPEFDLPPYDEALPDHTHLDTLNISRVIGSRNEPIDWTTDRIPGTERLSLRIEGDKGRKGIRIFSGENVIRSEFNRDHFFYSKEKIISFYLHHRLPDYAYLKDFTISKKIKIKLNKPLDSKKYNYDLVCLREPSDFDRSSLTSSSEHLEMEFHFNISHAQHYINVISLLPIKRTNFQIPDWMIAIGSAIRKIFIPTPG